MTQGMNKINELLTIHFLCKFIKGGDTTMNQFHGETFTGNFIGSRPEIDACLLSHYDF